MIGNWARIGRKSEFKSIQNQIKVFLSKYKGIKKIEQSSTANPHKIQKCNQIIWHNSKKFKFNTDQISYRYSSFRLQSQSFNQDMDLYNNMLQSHKRSMKKATQNMKQAEIKLITRILQAQNPSNVSTYLANLRHLKLFTVEALDKIEKYLDSKWNEIGRWEKICALEFLVEQNRFGLFEKYKESMEREMQKIRLDEKLLNNEKQIIQYILYTYCKNIVNQNLCEFKEDENILFSQIIQKIVLNKYLSWAKEYSYLYKIKQIKTNPNTDAVLDLSTNFQIPLLRDTKYKGRSNLQIQIQALLTTIGYSSKREKSIYGFSVDFVVYQKRSVVDSVEGKEKMSKQKCIIQVLGSHHYTVENKIFGKDILRAKILQNYLPVVLIHGEDINTIKGLQNKLKFLQQKIIESANLQSKSQRNRFQYVPNNS